MAGHASIEERQSVLGFAMFYLGRRPDQQEKCNDLPCHSCRGCRSPEDWAGVPCLIVSHTVSVGQRETSHQLCEQCDARLPPCVLLDSRGLGRGQYSVEGKAAACPASDSSLPQLTAVEARGLRRRSTVSDSLQPLKLRTAHHPKDPADLAPRSESTTFPPDLVGLLSLCLFLRGS